MRGLVVSELGGASGIDFYINPTLANRV